MAILASAFRLQGYFNLLYHNGCKGTNKKRHEEFFQLSFLLLNLYIYPVESNTHTETSECLILRGRLQNHELLEEMGTETIAAIIDILIIEIVVG